MGALVMIHSDDNDYSSSNLAPTQVVFVLFIRMRELAKITEKLSN
jgi:hypothetical protein